MKCNCIIVLMAFQAITCEKPVSEQQKQNSNKTLTNLEDAKSYEFCKNFSCPAIEDPQCVRMRQRATGVSYYFIAAHKCELKYLKCRVDVEGAVVSMKYCAHHTALIAAKQTNEKGMAHIRVKRRAVRARTAVKPHLHEVVKEETRKDNTGRQRKIKASRQNSRKPPQKLIVDINSIKLYDGYPLSSESVVDLEHNESAKIINGISGYPAVFETMLLAKYTKMPQDSKKERLKLKTQDFLQMISAESNANQPLGEVDMDQYKSACPTVCPSRDVMVCGKCQHGVHRSFSSVCHLRMFGCNHKEEIMQLEAHGPCVYSSPFISEPGMQPQGRVVEPDDEDKVLQFIRLRDRALLDVATPPDVSVITELPSYIPVCKQDPKKLADCIRKSIEDLRPMLKTGLKELNVPAVDPFVIKEVKEMTLDSPRVRVSGKNVSVTGASRFKIKSLTVDPDTLTITVHLFIPKLHIEGQYKLNARIMLLPVNGEGPFTTDAVKCELELVFHSQISKKLGKQYIKFKKIDVDIKLRDYKVRLEGLFDGDETLGNAANTEINNNRWEFYWATKGKLEKSIANDLLVAANNLVQGLPLDLLLPKP